MPVIGQNRHRALHREHLGAQGKFLKQTTHAKEGSPEMVFELCMEVWLGDRLYGGWQLGISETANSHVQKYIKIYIYKYIFI